MQSHFTEECYTVRPADGKRVLKAGSVPTVFPHRPVMKLRKPPTKRSCSSPQRPQSSQLFRADHTYPAQATDDLSSGKCCFCFGYSHLNLSGFLVLKILNLSGFLVLKILKFFLCFFFML